MKTFLVLYIPVIHQGYLNLFEKYSAKVDGLFILGDELVEERKFLVREIRAIDSATAKKFVEAGGYFKNVEILDASAAQRLEGCNIITSDESITRRFAVKYLPGCNIRYDSSFLRWDERSIVSRTDIKYDRESASPFDRELMRQAIEEGKKSPDWWRQVGAVAVKDGMVIGKAYNKDPISEYRPYAFGNIRDFVEAGKHSEITPTIHPEQVLAAKGGIKEADIYVSVFPCITCSGILAEAGIKRCFFASGNAYLDVENILKARGIELIFVK